MAMAMQSGIATSKVLILVGAGTSFFFTIYFPLHNKSRDELESNRFIRITHYLFCLQSLYFYMPVLLFVSILIYIRLNCTHQLLKFIHSYN